MFNAERSRRGKVALLIAFGFLSACLHGCSGLPPPLSPESFPSPIEDDGWVRELLRASPPLSPLAERAEEHRLQILVSEVIEGTAGSPPRLRRHGYRLESEYFYPASAIQLYAALGVAQWLTVTQRDAKRRDSFAADLSSAVRIGPATPGDDPITRDESNLAGGTITLGHEIRKLCIVSDNRAFDRLFELMSGPGLSRSARDAGFHSVRVRHRLGEEEAPADAEDLPLRRFEIEGKPWGTVVMNVFTLPEVRLDPIEPAEVPIGRAHLRDGVRVARPMDFSEKNVTSIADLQDALITTLRPEIEVGKPGYTLSDECRSFLARALCELPRASKNPIFDPESNPDDHVNFLLPGLRRVIPAEDLDVYAKTGLAYGFTVVNSYVVDRKAKKSFFIAACLSTNANETLNDGIDEYDEVAMPFWTELGEALARSLLR